jgi:methyl-accepting chemotaxis protein
MMMGQISSATSEQAQGVEEISKAMNQLSQVTHQTTSISKQALATAGQLGKEARNLGEMIRSLFDLIRGKMKVNEAEPRVVEENPIAAHSEFAPKVLPLPLSRRNRSSPLSREGLREEGGHRISALAREVPSKDDPRFEDV